MATTVFTENVVNAETGELISKKWINKESSRENFVLLYMEHIGTIAKLSQGQLATLVAIAELIEYNTGDFSLHPLAIQRVANSSKLSIGTIRNAITALKKKNLIQSKGTNWYTVNPKIFWKGTELERNKQFEVTYRWNIKE
jgi:hypothetical protein